MERYQSSAENGLTEEQVHKRIEEGLVNYDDSPKTKTIKQIIIDNFCTYFNFLNIALGFSVFLSSAFHGQLFLGLKNCLFMGVILINSIISIIEEIISKKIIDRLSVLSESTVLTIRDGIQKELRLEQLVLDDVTVLRAGHQVVADSILLEGEIEVNESLLTGEPDAILKKAGDMILSGSFLVSGQCKARVEHVGKDNYVSIISKEAKYDKKIHSVIMNSFENLLKVLSILIIPIAVVMYFSQIAATGGNITEAIFRTVAALIGMVPEGLVLLTSSVMAVSVIRLSRYKVLVQQLYCIETLARVDVICLDKTGTLTEGRMQVVDSIAYESFSKEKLKEILGAYATYTEDNNSTMMALKEYFNVPSDKHLLGRVPFSSERKFSGLEFEGLGSIYIGAPEFLIKEKNDAVAKILEPYQENYRVLLVAKGKEKITKNPKDLEVLGFIILEDIIRKEAKDTLEYFKKQGVLVKIISGDNITTVLNIANKIGLKDVKGIDVGTLNDDELVSKVLEYEVFGRVTPNQKKLIVETLQKSGRTVAMTGDGVNDVLALKQSDCAISVASGSDAARNVAQLVLLDNNFDSLPQVVAEGRRTINNIERSGSLLLVKTIYTILLILFSITISSKYFFVPIQLTLITTFTIGAPSFILALEPNTELVKGNFLLKIVTRSLPTALTVIFNVILVTCFATVFQLPYDLQSTLCVYLTALTGFIYLYKICTPFTWIRGILFSVMLGGFLYCVFWQYEFFNLTALSFTSALIAFVLCIDSLYIYRKLNHFITWLFSKFDKTIAVEQ